MYFQTAATFLLPLLSIAVTATPVESRSSGSACTFAKKVAGIQYEIDTISSHSFATADKIALSPLASRTFLVTPNELNGVTLPPINVGVTADTVRAELVGLATVLNASVPPKSVHYINNRNGSVTSDFIQNDRILLPHEHVREIHTFNDKCQITSILGYVHGNVVCPSNSSSLTNSALIELCASLEKAESGSSVAL